MQRFFITGVLVAALSLVGCGLKAPPAPPKPPPVPAVTELAYRLGDSAVVLEWALSERLSGRQARAARFRIDRYRAKLSEPVCDTCPLVFEQVGTVPYTDNDGRRFSTAVALDPGFRYGFKVRMQIDARVGADSKLVRFDFP